ncbi:MAG: hypothetical protein J6T96_15035, partial [Bacteroidales bacterium]|nr:hypothetical protein [Bacteroidales bacterium]
MEKTEDIKQKTANTIERVIFVTVALCTLILLLFDVYPCTENIPQGIRVLLYVVLDFSIALFCLEGVARFFLGWKRVEEHKDNEGSAHKTIQSFFASLDKISYCDIAVFVVVVVSFFYNEIELYGLRAVTLFVKTFFADEQRFFVNVNEFKMYFGLDGENDPDHNKADDRNRFLRYLVYFNLAFFILMAFEHIRDSRSIIAVWFIAT